MTPTTSVRREQMRARTRLIGDEGAPPLPSEPGFAWWHDGRGLVTEGVARRVPVAGVHDALAAIEVDAEHEVPATGPIAVGALGFDPKTMADVEMVIPARAWSYGVDGRTWVTEISEEAQDSEPSRVERSNVATRLDSGSDMSEEQWESAVGEALKRIEAGEIDKVVLARQLSIVCRTGFSIAEVVERLAAMQPGCYVFASDGFVGASPELLVERRGDVLRSRPMAGTVPRNDAQAVEWLARSAKNRWEHALVVDAIATGLAEHCSGLVQVSEPHAKPFADLSHIVTEVVGRLSSPAPSALDLALELHPTPAVAGVPTDAALALISDLETRRRGPYGGPVGWVNAGGDGEFALALRCAELRAERAVLYAGAGIVAGSTWEDEWRETEAKLEPMLRALFRH